MASGPERSDFDRLRERRERRRVGQTDGFQRALDEAELASAPAVETSDAAESVKDNDSEEGQEDRTGHGFHGPLTPQNARPRIDVAG